MPGAPVPFTVQRLLPLLLPMLALVGCSASQPPTRPTAAPPVSLLKLPPNLGLPAPEKLPPVMLGIDVLEAEGFAALKGKRVGLLTHPAAVNRRGIPTIDVLRHAAGVRLVALYGVEHGVYNELPAEKPYPDHLDPRTGLMIYSLYNGKSREPSPAQLKPIDVLVVDLQDIGTRSYTFISAMKLAMEACFKNRKEIVILDRPNPLGGLKVDGPLLDAKYVSYVGEFRVPYVHGLTIGELARMAKEAPHVLDVPDAVRARGQLLVIPMRGWTRAMRWPDTGLPWIPTSGRIQDFAAVLGYPMVGLGTYFDPPRKFDLGFRHGVGMNYDFRGLSHVTVKSEVLERDLQALQMPGVRFRRISAPERDGRPGTGVYVEITDFDAWRPTELNFYLMKLACKYDVRNPFLKLPGRDLSGFMHHMGSEDFLSAIQREGARIDVAAWVRRWEEQDRVYQQQSKRYWLYQ